MNSAEKDPAGTILSSLQTRFGADFPVTADQRGVAELAQIAGHRSIRRYTADPVAPELLRLLLACALSAPTKSDLQQADIIQITDTGKRQRIVAAIPDMAWILDAPVFLVFCGNNRRIRHIGGWRGKPFANEHLDHFMNAAVDAGIVMMNFIRAAEAAGLGTCPISAIRNAINATSDELELPEGVFPVAGLCVGYPATPGHISPRLSLEVTVHTNRYDESALRAQVDAYDQRRHANHPYGKQRRTKSFGTAEFYGWSEDKARQYAEPERADFGAYIRRQGFSLK
ncbi:MAG: nitroreductase family protein [Burkholderiales bacterium]|jgi:nitroreductase/FMN reductase [NAD(P)H]|nr:nitroreductase family protein [Burkholderiales bacterium]